MVLSPLESIHFEILTLRGIKVWVKFSLSWRIVIKMEMNSEKGRTDGPLAADVGVINYVLATLGRVKNNPSSSVKNDGAENAKPLFDSNQIPAGGCGTWFVR